MVCGMWRKESCGGEVAEWDMPGQEVKVNGAGCGKSHKLEDEDRDGVSMCNGGGRCY